MISVASNEIPREMADMTRAALNNDWDTARAHPPQIPAADAGQLHRVQSAAGQSSAGDDGKNRGSLSPAAACRCAATRARNYRKIATEAGLIAKPAARRAEAVNFYIYENWLAGPHKIVLHRSTCGQCNHGKGRPVRT